MFLSRNRDSAIALILGAALAAICFGAAGGSELSKTSLTEVLMLLAGAGVIAAALLWGRDGALDGATSLVAFALLAALTSLSVLWSIVPELSYIEAGRTLAYLAIFAAAIAGARLAPRAVPGVVGGVLLGAMLPVAYSLASRIWPASLAENELSNRIGAPFQYWNAVGTVAAIAIPLALWLGARRTGSMWLRALAYPAVGLSVLAARPDGNRRGGLRQRAWRKSFGLEFSTRPRGVRPGGGAALRRGGQAGRKPTGAGQGCGR